MKDINKIYRDAINEANAEQTQAIIDAGKELAKAVGEATQKNLDAIALANATHQAKVEAADKAWVEASQRKLDEFQGVVPVPEPKRGMLLPRAVDPVSPVDMEKFEETLRGHQS
jgi:uncharacterized protein YcaQ